jgi:hypothetical protein
MTRIGTLKSHWRYRVKTCLVKTGNEILMLN